MHCQKCGRVIESEENHVCAGNLQKLFEPVYTGGIPGPVGANGSLERTLLPLSGHMPEGMIIEDILSSRAQGAGLLKELRKILMIWRRFFKKPTKENIVLLIIGGVAFLLWLWTKYASGGYFGFGYDYIPPTGIKSVFAFIMGSFNNVPTRVLHYSAFMTLAAAYIPPIFSGNPARLGGNVRSTFELMRRLASYKKSKSTFIAVAALGAGLFFANYMMRNNSINKYFPCLTLGLTMILSSSGLFNATFVRLSKGLFNDIAKLLHIENSFNKYKVMLQIGFGSGLVLSVVACLIRKMSNSYFTDHMAYYIGGVIFVIGLAMVFASKDAGTKAEEVSKG